MDDNPTIIGNKPLFSIPLANKILIELDGWKIKTIETTTDESNQGTIIDESVEEEGTNTNEELDLFLDIETQDKLENININHKVSIDEIEHFYHTSFDEALSYTNRHDIDDLDEISLEIFMMAVYKLAASNLWNKYNIQINNDSMEGTHIVSQGGRLYKKACNILDKFIRTNFIGLHSLM